MHEMGLALSLLDAALDASPEDRRVTAVGIRLADPDSESLADLELAFEVASQGTRAAGAVLALEAAPPSGAAEPAPIAALSLRDVELVWIEVDDPPVGPHPAEPEE